MIFSFIDFGPRLITVTHHDAVAGPYHRNGQQIADVMNAWRGSADQAHRLIAKYRSDYVLSCPNSSTTTIFSVGSAEGLLRPACSRRGAGVAEAGRAAQGFAVPDVAGDRLAERAGKALLQAVDDELRGERGEDDAEDAGDRRLDLLADQLHQRAGGEQRNQGHQDDQR